MVLKANELRIGNYVKHKSQIRKIIELNLRYCKTDLINNVNYNSDSLSQYLDLQPIPLTEEWIFKFGFQKDIMVDLYRLHNQFGSIIYYPSTSLEKAKINFMLIGACFMNNTIINVH